MSAAQMQRGNPSIIPAQCPEASDCFGALLSIRDCSGYFAACVSVIVLPLLTAVTVPSGV